MNRFLRYLRIVFSAGCGVACVLLVALWVRSYWKWDRLFYFSTSGWTVVLNSVGGDTAAGIETASTPSSSSGFEFESLMASQLQLNSTERGFNFIQKANMSIVSTPYWFLVLISATIAAMPWLRWRFSLRTLLIATSLVAVVLGLILWAYRG